MTYQHYPKKHHFSHKLCRLHGIEGALLLRFFTDRQLQDHSTAHDKHFASADGPLLKHFPYLSVKRLKATVRNLVQRRALTCGLSDAKASPRVWNYQVPLPVSIESRRNSIRMDVEIATRISPLAGVLIEDIRYLTVSASSGSEPVYVDAPFRKLAGLLYVAPTELQSAHEQLKATGFLIGHPALLQQSRLRSSDPLFRRFRTTERATSAVQTHALPRDGKAIGSAFAASSEQTAIMPPVGREDSILTKLENYLDRGALDVSDGQLLADANGASKLGSLPALIATVTTHKIVSSYASLTKLESRELLRFLWGEQGNYSGVPLKPTEHIESPLAGLAKSIWQALHLALSDGTELY